MRNLIKRGCAVVLVCIATHHEARAAVIVVPVFDAEGLAATMQQVARTAAQVTQTAAQVRMLRDSARRLPEQAFGTIRRAVNRETAKFSKALEELRRVETRIGRAKDRYAALLNPELLVTQLSKVQRRQMAEGLHIELTAATRGAMKSQALLADVEQSVQVSSEVLRRSRGNNSQVTQLQLAVQLLASINKDLRNVVSVLSTQGRVAAAQVVSGVLEQRTARERSKSFYDGWTTGWQPSPGLE